LANNALRRKDHRRSRTIFFAQDDSGDLLFHKPIPLNSLPEAVFRPIIRLSIAGQWKTGPREIGYHFCR